ncbi:hypothetical protein [Bacillus sp. SM2101]|uniref:hypothetical protein n=1 Tax=Bacillus sp. SM2101 TaxID=2805366 RepID=UPI001BDF01DD|nr:hypothetical protein [Bacillus sp. SM2101]
MFNELTPIFQEIDNHSKTNSNPQNKMSPTQPSTKRKIRSDKGHNVKFPVSSELQRQFKTSRKRCLTLFPEFRDKIKQTKYNTLLLSYALDHLDIVDWDLPYSDSLQYMHTQLPEYRYKEIGGLYGIADEHNLSSRKCVYMMVVSALKEIERTEAYYEILQQIRAAKK